MTIQTPKVCMAFCTHCQSPHRLPEGSAKRAAIDLMERLDAQKRLDLNRPLEEADPRFSTDYLFGEARGKMFGVMVCRQSDGTRVTLKAFSGQYNGEWAIEGWVPPLFDLRQWHRVNDGPENEIKRLGKRINTVGTETSLGRELIKQRRQCSRELMKELHHLYRLHNFRAQSCSLAEAYIGKNGIPNGTADCCAPKLLNHAACNDLHPLGLAEFYYGRPNKRGTRHHRRFYSPCQEKCGPILGFMLCGLNPEPSDNERNRGHGV